MDLANEGPPQPIEIDWFWVAGALLLIGCGLESFQGTLATFEIAFSRHRTRTNFFFCHVTVRQIFSKLAVGDF